MLEGSGGMSAWE